MKNLYVKTNKDNVIIDAIEYEHEGFTYIQVEDFPASILDGSFKLENGVIVEYEELRPVREELEFKRQAEIERKIQENVLSNIGAQMDVRLNTIENNLATQTTAVDLYNRLDKESATLEELREAKYYALKEECDNHILGGFYSPSTDAMYGFTEIDQMNMTQQMILFFIDPSPVNWKTEDKGLIELTKEQFVQVAFEAQAHKQKQITNWWQLKANVLAAQTKEEIMELEWEGTIL